MILLSKGETPVPGDGVLPGLANKAVLRKDAERGRLAPFEGCKDAQSNAARCYAGGRQCILKQRPYRPANSRWAHPRAKSAPNDMTVARSPGTKFRSCIRSPSPSMR